MPERENRPERNELRIVNEKLQIMNTPTPRLPIVERDEWLRPVEEEMNRRWERYRRKVDDIRRTAGSLADYANG